jgi:membrane protease YdiL (CAAX protease family)
MLEREDTRPRWPVWYGIAALLLAVIFTGLASAILLGLLKAFGVSVDSSSSGATLVATAIQDAALAGCAIFLAANIARPRAAQFGLRAIPFRSGLKWGAIAFAIYFGFQLIYAAAIHPDEKQTTLKDLGAGSAPALTLLIGVLVVGVAPVVEEFFFRGFVFGSLRSHMPFLAAAVIDGLIFGAVHAPSGVQAVPPLMVLGFALCLAYEATGSILPGIVLHSLNNMIAFGVDKNGSWAVGAVVASLVFLTCVTVPGRRRTLT